MMIELGPLGPYLLPPRGERGVGESTGRWHACRTYRTYPRLEKGLGEPGSSKSALFFLWHCHLSMLSFAGGRGEGCMYIGLISKVGWFIHVLQHYT